MKKRILLVDDDLAVRESLARVLETEGFEVVMAADGRDALAQFTNHRPDLVLLDLNMPHKDGWAALEDMSQFDPWLPVIVITARPHQYQRAIGAGCDALMEKPLDLALLLDKMRELLAESPRERVARLTSPEFVTTRLPSAVQS